MAETHSFNMEAGRSLDKLIDSNVTGQSKSRYNQGTCSAGRGDRTSCN